MYVLMWANEENLFTRTGAAVATEARNARGAREA
jgi:hypothetical protein